jgi:hypothetical protein
MGVEYEHYILPVQRDHRPSAAALVRLIAALRRDRWIVAPDHPQLEELRGGPMNVGDSVTGWVERPANNPWAAQGVHGRPTRTPVIDAPTAAWLDGLAPVDVPAPLSNELRLAFPVDFVGDAFSTFEEAGIEYPFTFGADDLDPNYHVVELHLADDFVTHGGNTFDPVSTTCSCGAELGYPIDRVAYVPALPHPDRARRRCLACGTDLDPKRRAAEVRDGWTGQKRQLLGGVTYRFALRIDCHKGWPRDRGPITLRPELVDLVAKELGVPCEDVGGLY